MKARIGTDSATKLVHTVVATAANLDDGHALPKFICTENRNPRRFVCSRYRKSGIAYDEERGNSLSMIANSFRRDG